MTHTSLTAMSLALTLSASAAVSQADDAAAEDLLQRLQGVAPAAVLEGATLMDVTADGAVTMLREGSNGWICMYPGTDPMCADEAAMGFMDAYLKNEDPPNSVGFIYMLLGDQGASNTDPYAQGETDDNQWVVSGPHVMIVGPGAQPMVDAYPHEVPGDAGAPWVMWPDTPYAHLMLPAQ